MAGLHTPLCDLLGIDAPIVQSGMRRVAGPELVAEVSNAGALGILAGFTVPPEELRAQIRAVRERTGRPFGVNLWLHPEVLPPRDPAGLPDDLVAAVKGALDPMRARLGLPAAPARPPPPPDLVERSFEVLLDERVPVFSVGLGDPGSERVRRCHERGVRVMAMVATVEEARTVAAAGVDVVVAQGAEAGGHRSTWGPAAAERGRIGTMALVPQVVDAVAVPVIASGGIADGRGLAAALALGAGGALLGTRFLATRESAAEPSWKRAVLERSSDDTTVTRAFSGLPARVFRNDFSEGYAASGAPVLPPLLQSAAARDVVARAQAADDPRFMPLFAGQANGLIHDLPGAAEVVARLVREAEEALARLRPGRAG